MPVDPDFQLLLLFLTAADSLQSFTHKIVWKQRKNISVPNIFLTSNLKVFFGVQRGVYVISLYGAVLYI